MLHIREFIDSQRLLFWNIPSRTTEGLPPLHMSMSRYTPMTMPAAALRFASGSDASLSFICHPKKCQMGLQKLSLHKRKEIQLFLTWCKTCCRIHSEQIFIRLYQNNVIHVILVITESMRFSRNNIINDATKTRSSSSIETEKALNYLSDEGKWESEQNGISVARN